MIAAEFIDQALRARLKPRIRLVYFPRARFGPDRIEMPGWRWMCGDENTSVGFGLTPRESYARWAMLENRP